MTIKHLRPGKENVNIPDFFEVKIKHISGAKQVIQAVNRTLVNCQFIPNPQGGQTILPLSGNSYWEFLTSDNLYVQVPIGSIESIEYDLNFTKLIEAAQKRQTKIKEDLAENKVLLDDGKEVVEQVQPGAVE
jgi:hypothetical protein